MKATDFTTTLLVNQSPEEVFDSINNVRGWWSEQIEGRTEKTNDEFVYHFKDVHICSIKLAEVVRGQKVVWQVLDNYFNFTADKHEWRGTRIIFEIASRGSQTELRFTHEGLVPAYECFTVCSNAWSNYINNSLRQLITTGKGTPNPRKGGFNQQLIDQHLDQPGKIMNKEKDLHISVTVKASAHKAFRCINLVSQWWTENLEGRSAAPGDEFAVRFEDIHYSRQKLVELIPDRKVVWLVTDSSLNFTENPEEWTGTQIVFEIISKDEETEIHFTHKGLNPGVECYEACSGAWEAYIRGSLPDLINTGKGHPTPSAI